MNRKLKRILKVTGIALGSFLGFVLIYLCATYLLPRIPVNKNPVTGKYATIYILTNGAHTDIVVPVRTDVMDWSTIVKTEDTRGKNPYAELVAFGWGDKGFYLDTPTWADLRFSVAFKAVFALSTSAMHITFYRHLVEGEQCRAIHIGRDQYAALVGYILDSFRKDEHGNVILVGTDAQYGPDDAFYEAKGRYNLFFTCNTWANNALKACGQRAALWTAFDTGIFRHYSLTY